MDGSDAHDHARPEAGGAFTVAILVYPYCTLLDFAGPQAALASLPGARVHLCWRSTGPVITDTGTVILADTALIDAPEAPDVLLVPGGAAGTLALLHDHGVLDWIGAVGSRARWVTSVCTGSLLLGAAGLLDGHRATSHWLVRDALALFGAVPTAGRIVTDRNRMTGGGVTAGIDFGLTLAARVAGEDAARAIQLALEYAPEPPFDSGSPERAGAAAVAAVRAAYDLPAAKAALSAAASRLSGRRAMFAPVSSRTIAKETDHAAAP